MQEDPLIEAIVRLVARTMDALEVLAFIARHLHPPDSAALAAVLGDADTALRDARASFLAAVWPEHLAAFRDQAERAAALTLRACDGLRAAAAGADGLRQAFRALRQVGRAQEALYPLAASMPSVSRFFLLPDRRDDQALLDALAAGAARTDVQVGVLHAANTTDERGGFSVFVPENYDPARAYPLVMALHGGSGHGRLFLWSWVREARSRGVIVVAPTASGDTWSLMQPEVDAAHLADVLEQVARTWRVDRSRLLLTGMSDGGTFTLISGIELELALHPPGAGGGELSSAAAHDGRTSADGGAAGLSGARGAGLDVPGVDGAFRVRRTGCGRREGGVPRDRRPVARISARGECANPDVVPGGLILTLGCRRRSCHG